MKKIISSLFLLITILLLVGCGDSINVKKLEEYANGIQIQAEASEDFHLVRTVGENNKVYVSWTSSDSSVIKIGNLATVDNVQYFTAKVTLPVEETKVTLTALLETEDGSINFEKTFEVTVKARQAEGRWKSVSYAIDEANKLDGSTNQKSTNKYLISGTVKEIKNAEYCNFYLTDGNQDIYVYGLYTSDGKKSYGTKEGKEGMPIKAGDVVYLYTTIQMYGTTPELVSAWLVDETYEPSAEVTPTEIQTKTIAEALAIAATLNKDSQEVTSDYYYISGTVQEIVKETYCNFNLTDGTNTILVYGITNDSGSKYGTNDGFLGIPFKAGYTVKLKTQIQNYNGTYELKNAVLLSYEEGEEITVEAKEVKVKEALTVENDTKIKITGVVTTILSKGFIISDETGSINVYGDTTITKNQKVEIVGTKAKYYNLPQVELSTCTAVGEGTIDITYTEYEYDKLPTDFESEAFYANYVTFKGEVTETGEISTPYAIMPIGSSNGFIISKYTNAEGLAELKEYIGKYVSVKAVVYDSKDNVWRFAYCEGTIAEEETPELTNEQKFNAVKAELEKEFSGILVRKDLELPLIGKYDTTIVWKSSDPSISSTGKFSAPEKDMEVVLTATISSGETVLGTVELKVTSKVAVTTVGESYKYTFVKGVFSKTDETQKLGTLNWHMVNNGGYYGFDTSTAAKGLQIGSKSNPASSISLSTNEYEGVVKSISIEIAGANNISSETTLVIKIGGVQVGTQKVSSTSTKVAFECSASGEIEILVTGADKAIYFKSLTIN